MKILLLLLLKLFTTNVSSSSSSTASANVINGFKNTAFKNSFENQDSISIVSDKIDLNKIFSKVTRKQIKSKNSDQKIESKDFKTIFSLSSGLFFRKKLTLNRRGEYDDNTMTIIYNDTEDKYNFEISVLKETNNTLTIRSNSQSNDLSIKRLKKICNQLLQIYIQEINDEIKVLEIRTFQLSRLSQETKEELNRMKKVNIDKVINPEKYSKPRGRLKPGSSDEAMRYKPSDDLLSRRQVNKNRCG